MPTKVARDLRQRALREIAEIVRQFTIQTTDQRRLAEIAIVAERHLTQNEEPDRIEPVGLHQG